MGSNTKTGMRAYVAGTFDTKARELLYLRDCLRREGVAVTTVDLSTTTDAVPTPEADISPLTVATYHPMAAAAVFTGERGSAVKAMADAFVQFIRTRDDLAGIIAAGGSGATSLATPAMRALPVGIPKVMVSTIASGDVRPHVGSSDIAMIYPVTDVQGLNRISRRVLRRSSPSPAASMPRRCWSSWSGMRTCRCSRHRRVGARTRRLSTRPPPPPR